MDEYLEKYHKNYSLNNIEINLTNLVNLLPSLKEELELWNWWNKMDNTWRKIILKNYEFSEHTFSLFNHSYIVHRVFNQGEGYEVALNNYKITIDFLKKLTKLSFIYAKAANIESCAPVSMLKNLKILVLDDNNIIDISCLEHLKKLKLLSIDSNPKLKDENNIIGKLNSLENLTIDKTQIKLSKNKFSSLSNLVSISAEDNIIDDDFDLNDIAKLEFFYSTKFLESKILAQKHYPKLEFMVYGLEDVNDKHLEIFKKMNSHVKINPIGYMFALIYNLK